MCEDKFTKGPWEVKRTIISDFRVKGKDKKGMQGKIIGDIRAKANANLIAAAPEMYDLLDSIENDNDQVPEWLYSKIQSTLAKARGEHA